MKQFYDKFTEFSLAILVWVWIVFGVMAVMELFNNSLICTENVGGEGYIVNICVYE